MSEQTGLSHAVLILTQAGLIRVDVILLGSGDENHCTIASYFYDQSFV